MKTSRFLLVTLMAVALAACGKKDDGAGGAKKPATDKGGAPGADKGGGDKPPAEEPPKIDPDYQAALEAVLAGCKVDASGCTVTECKNDEMGAFDKLVNEKKKKRTDALDVLGVWLSDADMNKVTVAANVMSSRFGTLNPEPGPVSKSTSGRLIAAVGKLEKCHAVQAAAATTHAAMLAGDDRLYAMAAQHKNEWVAPRVYESLLQHGRDKPMAKIKEIAGTAAPRQLAALARAPRSMYEASDAEKAAVCPWAQGLLGHADGDVAYEAGFTMAWCGGEYVDALIAEGEKRLGAGGFDKPFSEAFREPCMQFISTQRSDAQNAQCEKVYAFLEKVANTDGVKPEVRGRALWNIYYQERTQATYDRLKKYKKHKEPEIQKSVADAMGSLEKSYGAK